MRTVRSKVALLETLPEMGSPVEDLRFPGYRELIVRNYRIIYRVRNGDCEISAIFRAEQDINRAFGSEPPS
jgi:plasmid stabilization system protein ParE